MQKSTVWRGFILVDASSEVRKLNFDICWTESEVDGCRPCSNHRDSFICHPILE